MGDITIQMLKYHHNDAETVGAVGLYGLAPWDATRFALMHALWQIYTAYQRLSANPLSHGVPLRKSHPMRHEQFHGYMSASYCASVYPAANISQDIPWLVPCCIQWHFPS